MNSDGDPHKRCWACGETKPHSAFAFANRYLGTLQGHCRICHAGFRRAHYLANKADYVRRAMAQVRARLHENRHQMVRYFLAHPCVGCGETDPVVLEFDHRDPAKKVMAVTAMVVRRRWASVLVEIDKCDVRCVNCHRRRTAQQFSWGKLSRRPRMDVMRE